MYFPNGHNFRPNSQKKSRSASGGAALFWNSPECNWSSAPENFESLSLSAAPEFFEERKLERPPRKNMTKRAAEFSPQFNSLIFFSFIPWNLPLSERCRIRPTLMEHHGSTNHLHTTSGFLEGSKVGVHVKGH